MTKQEDLARVIENAARLHGHLGPFLVVGVRMGTIAKRQLCSSDNELALLSANAKVPLFPPYSCLLDGIQVTTTCTVGNQRLSVENSNEKIGRAHV
jgi:formylmethanofuran dehydrogenase subunit E